MSHRIISGGNPKHQKLLCIKKDKYQYKASHTKEILYQFIQKVNIPSLYKKYLPLRVLLLLLLFVVDSNENVQTNSDTYSVCVRHKYNLHVSNTNLNKYVVLPKISENLLVITWILTSSLNFHRHLRSSHLGLVYNDPSDFATFGNTHWSMPALACLVSVAILLGLLQWRRNIALSTGVSF